MTTSRSKGATRRARASAAALIGAVAAMATSGAPAFAQDPPQPPNHRETAQLETEIEAVADAAAGGADVLLEFLESCWRSSAGYGVEALAPCALRERVALILLDLLDQKIGSVDAATLTPAAAAKRIAAAYEGREIAPDLAPKLSVLIRYALSRRIEAGWAGALSLETVRTQIGEARRIALEQGVAVLIRRGDDCWMRLVLTARDLNRKKRAAAAWKCRLQDVLAHVAAKVETTAPTPDGARRVESIAADRAARERYFDEAAAADPFAVAATAAVAEALWPHQPLE